MKAEANPSESPGESPASTAPRWLVATERAIGSTVEVITALLVLVEIFVLLAGVTSRYIFRAPITWTDEFASLLFLWLAMLGAVVALRRGEHMRMTALVAKANPSKRAFLDTFALVAALAFLLLVVPFAFEFAHEEVIVTTPALGISSAWRASALPTGITLMLVLGLLRLATTASWRPIARSIAVVVVAAAVLIALGPVFIRLGNYDLLIFFVLLVGALVLSGVPIAFSFGLATLGYLALATTMPAVVIIGRMDEGMSHIILLSIPLFVFLGLLIEMTGMAKAMVAFLASLLGHVRGGLSYVLVGGDVSGIRHLRLQGGRHGGGRTGSVSGDEGARRQAGRSGGVAVGDRRADRNDSA